MFKIFLNLKHSIFLLFFLLNSHVFSQTLEELLKNILKKDESISSSRVAIDKANNDLSSITSLFTPKIDLSLPVGNEKLINNDSANTNFDYYEFSAKISQNIYDFGNSFSKYKNAKNKVKMAEISKNKKRILDSFLTLMKESAVDCNFNKRDNIRKKDKSLRKRN